MTNTTIQGICDGLGVCDCGYPIQAHFDKKSYLKGYNSGWRAASRVRPEKLAYFAAQLEDAALKLRNVENNLKQEELNNGQ